MILTYEGQNQNGHHVRSATNCETADEIINRLRRNDWRWAEIRDESGAVIAEF